MRLRRIAASVSAYIILGTCALQAQAPDASPTIGESVAVEGGQYTDIIVPELQIILRDKDFPLINVHIPFAGNLPDTDDSIPFNEIEANLDRLPADKDARIVLYCRTGPMSERAAAALVRLGYTNVYNLVGGLAAWSAAGLPLVGQ